MRNLVIIALLFFSLCTTQNVQSQNMAVGIQTGFNAYIANTSTAIPVGANAEWAINATHALAVLAQYNIGLGAFSPNLFYLSPIYKYYVIGEALSGFYVGGFLGFGGGSGTGYLAVGGNTGYSFPVGENFNLDAAMQLGYGNYLATGFGLLHLMFTLGARYTF